MGGGEGGSGFQGQSHIHSKFKTSLRGMSLPQHLRPKPCGCVNIGYSAVYMATSAYSPNHQTQTVGRFNLPSHQEGLPHSWKPGKSNSETPCVAFWELWSFVHPGEARVCVAGRGGGGEGKGSTGPEVTAKPTVGVERGGCLARPTA